ncbi:hypothetical protein lerEdw1_003858 [Lerista edwardsae]|nr:hypothetical protein lerEdw1_003858 [Lerista edwardsae]
MLLLLYVLLSPATVTTEKNILIESVLLFPGELLLLVTMFVLVEMTDTVRIPPWQFERKLNDAITEELNKKLANKVVYNVGLCICLYDITKLEDSYIFPGDGASHTKERKKCNFMCYVVMIHAFLSPLVHFRYVVFHPFPDEILVGVIKGCSLEGVRVSLGFFDDILIPPESLQQPSKFDEAEQVWVWEYETEEGAHDLYMDTGEEIRFRVSDEIFIDTSPTGPSSAEPSTSGAGDEVQKKEAPLHAGGKYFTLHTQQYEKKSLIATQMRSKEGCNGGVWNSIVS